MQSKVEIVYLGRRHVHINDIEFEARTLHNTMPGAR